MSKVTVDLQMAFDGTGVPSEALFEAWAEAAWQDENPTEVTIRIVDNDESRVRGLLTTGKRLGVWGSAEGIRCRCHLRPVVTALQAEQMQYRLRRVQGASSCQRMLGIVATVLALAVSCTCQCVYIYYVAPRNCG